MKSVCQAFSLVMLLLLLLLGPKMRRLAPIWLSLGSAARICQSARFRVHGLMKVCVELLEVLQGLQGLRVLVVADDELLQLLQACDGSPVDWLNQAEVRHLQVDAASDALHVDLLGPCVAVAGHGQDHLAQPGVACWGPLPLLRAHPDAQALIDKLW